jgi:hypothetical protein
MNNLRTGILAFIFLLTGFVACSGRHSPGKPDNTTNVPEKGKVISDVRCLKNNDISYSLYLPTGYGPGKKFPVILAFDPHAGGNLPVEKYKDLAEEHGCILIGSNNSKNGQQLNEVGTIVQGLFDEINSRYVIDTNRIYTLGFSGGSRIASMIVLYQYPVAGVIGCGAGFPSTNQAPRSRFDYLGIVGNSDFNMNELISLDDQLETAKFRHALIIFDGIHAWPPFDIMKEAFIWNDFSAMKDNKIPRDQMAIDGYLKFMEGKIVKEQKSGDILAYHRDLLNESRFLEGLANTGTFKAAITELERTTEYKKALKAEQETAAWEAKEQKMLTDNFFIQDLPWWKRTLASYNSRIIHPKDSNDVRVCRRMKSYFSLVCYMSYTRVLASHDSVAAEKAMRIYELVDPENADKTKKDTGK